MFFPTFFLGALTSKPYAFGARPWELETVETFDFFDSYGGALRVDLRGREVMRVLPRAVGPDQWIADRARFGYDAFRRQRLIAPLSKLIPSDGEIPIRKLERLVPSSWPAALAVMGSSLRPLPAISFGPSVDLPSAQAAISFGSILAGAGFGPRLPPSSDVDGRPSYLGATLEGALASADLLLLVGISPRLQLPLLNLRLRAAVGGRRIAAYAHGCAPSSFNFAVTDLGSDPSALLRLWEGRSRLSVPLASASRPLVLSSTPLPPAFLGRLRRVRVFPICPFSGHLAAAEVGLPPAPSSPPLVAKPALWLFADDRFLPGPSVPLTVYFGHHGDLGASRADLVLPVPAPFEGGAPLLGLDGRPRPMAPLFSPPSGSRPIPSILGALAAYLGLPPLPAPPILRSSAAALAIQPPFLPVRVANVPHLPPSPSPFLFDAVSRSSHHLALASVRFSSPAAFPHSIPSS